MSNNAHGDLFFKALQQPGKCVSIKSPIQLTCSKDLTGLSKVLEVVDYNVLYTGSFQPYLGETYTAERVDHVYLDSYKV
jgi:hypothetical protein